MKGDEMIVDYSERIKKLGEKIDKIKEYL